MYRDKNDIFISVEIRKSPLWHVSKIFALKLNRVGQRLIQQMSFLYYDVQRADF